jgi:hypothetical protein
VRLLVIICCCCLAHAVFAQLRSPIGDWREHYPYAMLYSVEQTPNKIFASTNYAIFSIDNDTGEETRYTNINGLSEVLTSTLAYNNNAEQLWCGYENGNIDVLTNKGFKNIDDIKRRNIIADKKIYTIYHTSSQAFVCTGFGLVTMSTGKLETNDTYNFGAAGAINRVNDFTILGGQYFAATAIGLYSINATNPSINNFNQWQAVSGTVNINISFVKTLGNAIYWVRNDSLFSTISNTTSFVFRDNFSIINCQTSNNKLILCLRNQTNGDSKVVVLNAAGLVQQTISRPGAISYPNAAINTTGNTYYIADRFGGFSKFENSNYTNLTPVAPPGNVYGQIINANNAMYFAAGEVDDRWNYQFNRLGIFELKDNTQWKFYNQRSQSILDTVLDFITLANSSNQLYAGSYGGGLAILNTDNTNITVRKQGFIANNPLDVGSYRVAGLLFDADENLWIANYGAIQPLMVQTPNNQVYRFRPPFPLFENTTAAMVQDADNQLWIQSPRGNGLLAYNYGASLSSNADDRWKLYTTAQGLPSNEVTSIALDKNNILWVGTTNGVAILTCTGDAFTAAGCPAQKPIISQGNFAGLLLQNEVVQSIAIDGANNKWMATRNGVFYLNAEADKVLLYFNTNNSPLPSNNVRTIGINNETGEVFFGTNGGMVSYRSTATQATESFSEVLVFPNPVPPNYNGLIAIKGLAQNAQVKIINAEGNLVTQGIANGGQFTWNGRNYKNEKTVSGMYTVLMRSADGVEKAVTKIAIVQ